MVSSAVKEAEGESDDSDGSERRIQWMDQRQNHAALLLHRSTGAMWP
jgi:hypothetical protein